MMSYLQLRLFVCVILLSIAASASDGHELWLRSRTPSPVNITSTKRSATINIAIKELEQGWEGAPNAAIQLIVKKDSELKNDGFRINKNKVIASTDVGILYGVYELLRRQYTGQAIEEKIFNPSYMHRILNHWDNLNGSIERGYAGQSIFWRKDSSFVITETDKKLWQEYARANASIGINGSALNNVNASHLILTPDYLKRVAAIAEVFRPYGIKVYLSVKFSSPALLNQFKTSDPLNAEVANWWKAKAKEIYQLIPDFGGFLVKANSEGQPGPQDYGRTHADGANMLADAVKPFGGIVMWRAFVYSPNDKDRAKQAYNEFIPLDGQFRDNVIVQVKNGPIDFQPREPFSPLFGAMKKTPVMPEFQITQEYLGHSTHLVFLATMWNECLASDTYQQGTNSTVGRTTDGSIFPHPHTAIAGVANIGLDSNWCGHLFAQSNWFAFGRLAWNNTMNSEAIANEWIRLTFRDVTNRSQLAEDPLSEWYQNFYLPVKEMMLESREAAVNYMTPLGLHHIMSANEHYGPGPWWAPPRVRADWTPPYYHQADSNGIGFNRTSTGTDAVHQYHTELSKIFNDPAQCPESLLLWFHHLPWTYKMKSGYNLWQELCHRYALGVGQVRQFQKSWDGIERYIDRERFIHVQKKLRSQSANAILWRDACLLYFQQFSKMPIPSELERPVHDLQQMIESDQRAMRPQGPPRSAPAGNSAQRPQSQE